MTTVLIGHAKGGVGKSTVATNLAVALAHQGRDVLLVDADRQCTSTMWAHERAQSNAAIQVPAVQVSGDVRPALQDLGRRYDDLIVDVSGRDSTELRTAMIVANVLLVPTRPSQADLWVLQQLSEMVSDVQVLNESLQTRAVINMAPHNTAEGKEARHMFDDFPMFRLTETVLYDRKVYREAMTAGAGVIELGNAKAAAEMTALAGEFFGGTNVQICA